jgi:hypothetical protein
MNTATTHDRNLHRQTPHPETETTSRMTNHANLARLDDLRLRPEAGRQLNRETAGSTTSPHEEIHVHINENISIRRATEADRPRLERLAALDSARVPPGEVLIAAVGDEPRAAIAIATRATIADPFRPTAHLTELLSLRASRLRGRSPFRRRLHWRSAYVS